MLSAMPSPRGGLIGHFGLRTVPAGQWQSGLWLQSLSGNRKLCHTKCLWLLAATQKASRCVHGGWQANREDAPLQRSCFEFLPVIFFSFQGQSQSGGHGPGGGKKDDKVSDQQPAVSASSGNPGSSQVTASGSGPGMHGY